MVHDERFLAGSSFLEDVVATWDASLTLVKASAQSNRLCVVEVLHLETLQDDIELLRDTLCRRPAAQPGHT